MHMAQNDNLDIKQMQDQWSAYKDYNIDDIDAMLRFVTGQGAGPLEQISRGEIPEDYKRQDWSGNPVLSQEQIEMAASRGEAELQEGQNLIDIFNRLDYLDYESAPPEYDMKAIDAQTKSFVDSLIGTEKGKEYEKLSNWYEKDALNELGEDKWIALHDNELASTSAGKKYKKLQSLEESLHKQINEQVLNIDLDEYSLKAPSQEAYTSNKNVLARDYAVELINALYNATRAQGVSLQEFGVADYIDKLASMGGQSEFDYYKTLFDFPDIYRHGLTTPPGRRIDLELDYKTGSPKLLK